MFARNNSIPGKWTTSPRSYREVVASLGNWHLLFWRHLLIFSLIFRRKVNSKSHSKRKNMTKNRFQLEKSPKVTKPERAGIYRDGNDENDSKFDDPWRKSHKRLKLTMELKIWHKIDSNSKKSPKVTKPERAGIYRDGNDENDSKFDDPWRKSHWQIVTFVKTRKMAKKRGLWVIETPTFQLFLVLTRLFFSKSHFFSLFTVNSSQSHRFQSLTSSLHQTPLSDTLFHREYKLLTR